MKRLPIGTKIRFVKTLEDAATGDHPDLLYAEAGEAGEIIGHDAKEGYNVKSVHWPTSFGASRDEFEPLPPSP